MRAYYEAGDKFYPCDYDNDTFWEIQNNLSVLSMDPANKVALESGSDAKGEYITLVAVPEKSIDEQPLYTLQFAKQEELKLELERAINKPVEFDGAMYDCDNMSVVRMTMCAKAARLGMKIPFWTDADDKEHTENALGIIQGVLKAYYARNIEFDKKYKAYWDKVTTCNDKQEVVDMKFVF